MDGFVLAGGQSLRFGSDKAVAEVDGLPMALWVASALAGVCERVQIIRRVDQPPRSWTLPDGVQVAERRGAEEGRHPLWGVAVALAAATSELVLVAPCDLPGLRPAHLMGITDPFVAWDDDRVHPLLAALPRAWLDRVIDAARAGESVAAVTGDLPRRRMPAEALRNVNR